LGALFGARDSAVLWQRLMTQRGRYDDPITAQVAQEFLALLAICGLYAQLLKPGKSDALALLVEGPIATSSADIAYITHFCDALFKSRGTLSLSAERGARRFEPFQLAHPLLDLGELAYVIEQDALTDAELGFVLRHSRSPHVLTSAIDFALRNGRVLEGLDWREVRGELSLGVRQYRSMMVSMLLAAKFICADDPRWCERDTPLLFVVCSRGETACAVGDDLDAIARNSLTAREHRWWSSARLPL
jgi:hypothetical protein